MKKHGQNQYKVSEKLKEQLFCMSYVHESFHFFFFVIISSLYSVEQDGGFEDAVGPPGSLEG